MAAKKESKDSKAQEKSHEERFKEGEAHRREQAQARKAEVEKASDES